MDMPNQAMPQEHQPSIQPAHPQGRYVVPARTKRRALYWMLIPWIVTVVLFLIWGILGIFAARSLYSGLSLIPVASAQTAATWTASDLGAGQIESEIKLGSGDVRGVAFKIVNVAFGFLIMLSYLFVGIGFIVAIVLFTRKELDTTTVYDERSGKGSASMVPEEVKGWNWGAAGFPIMWGMYHGVWIGLLAFVPFVNLIWWIIMGIKGNEWAWENDSWQNVAQFKAAQRKWMPWGIAVFVVQALVIIGYLSLAAFAVSKFAWR